MDSYSIFSSTYHRKIDTIPRWLNNGVFLCPKISVKYKKSYKNLILYKDKNVVQEDNKVKFESYPNKKEVSNRLQRKQTRKKNYKINKEMKVVKEAK